MLSRDAKFATAAAVIALISLVTSGIVLRNIAGEQATIDGRIQRLAKDQERIIQLEANASAELNFSNLYLTFYEMQEDRTRAQPFLDAAGAHFFASYWMELLPDYVVAIPEGFEKLAILQSQLAQKRKLFSQDFFTAEAQTKSLRTKLANEKARILRGFMNERNALQARRAGLERREGRVEFMSTTIQFLSIMLVLVKDAFKPKKEVA